MPSPLSLDDFADPPQSPSGGSTPRQHEFILQLLDWLDLTREDAIDLAIELIPMSGMDGGREIRALGDLTVGEASELIEELKSRKQVELGNRRKGGGRRW